MQWYACNDSLRTGLIAVGDVALLNSAFDSAFTMVDRALDSIGQAPPAGSAHLWEFPDAEARDLAGRIFGSAVQSNAGAIISLTDRLNLVKGKLLESAHPYF